MPKILGAALLALLAAACGQKGDLYYAKDAAARNRASLGQALLCTWHGRLGLHNIFLFSLPAP
ncbi:MAG TPA: hypothetical protein VGE47_17230 [Burkholderiaceae bacterium]